VEAAAEQHRLLVRCMGLSIAAALTTIALKSAAAAITGSVGFLSDALESGVNLVAAVVGLLAVRTSAKPPDAEHQFGHGDAEYLSAAVEGTMIFGAAAAIVWTSAHRLIDPVALYKPGLGLALSTAAALVNLGVALTLLRIGRRHRSITLVADGKHLLTDVWTSAGVVVGIALVAIFDLEVLDPIVALLVGVNILHTGYGLLRRSVVGLLGAALPAVDVARVDAVIARYRQEEPVRFHDLRTRESGRLRFVYVHMLVPDHWTVKRAHQLADRVEADIERELPSARASIHIEPTDDPASYDHPGGDDERPASGPASEPAAHDAADAPPPSVR
jgi:cation diffusion facilitator family transporter